MPGSLASHRSLPWMGGEPSQVCSNRSVTAVVTPATLVTSSTAIHPVVGVA